MSDQFKIKIIAIAKDEAAYMPQWIYHHLNFGFDAVELWLNDTSDNSLPLLRKIQGELGDDVVSIVEADDYLAKCVEAKRHFQSEAYNLAYRREAERGVYTHLMFLDMDELWTPANFEDSIKTVLNRYPQSDAISFLWMVDIPDLHREPFSRPFLLQNSFQKNRHVKSLVKISPKVQKVGIHNHLVKNGVFHLSDGSPFDPSEDVIRVNWAYISVAQIKARLGTPEEHFVVHQVFRSKQEYLSSLLRGRRHIGDHDNVFKTNRNGYIPFHADTHTAELRIPEEKLSKYESGFAEFVRKTRVADLLRAAQDFIVDRCEAAFATLRADPTLIGKYERQLQGLPDIEAKVNGISVFGKIESAARVTQDDCLEIKGWAYDVAHRRPLEFQYRNSAGQLIPLFSQKVARFDLSKRRSELGLDCGFRIEITPEQASSIETELLNDKFEIILKTNDGEGQHSLFINKTALRARSRGQGRKLPKPYGTVQTAVVREGAVHFSGEILCKSDGVLELYAAIDSLLFPLKFDMQRRGDGKAEVTVFSASLTLTGAPKDLHTKPLHFYVVVDGRSYPLAIGRTYSYPAEAIATFYRSKLPTLVLKSSLPSLEHSCLVELLPNATTYLTYGASDTVFTAMRAGVKNIVAIDSDATIIQSLKDRLSVESKSFDQTVYPVHADIGKTKELGYPVDTSGWKLYPLYAVMPWDLCNAKGMSPDLILIDARFRVASFLVSLIMAEPGAILLFDDYVDRPQYHIVERVLKPSKVYGRMAKFMVPAEFDRGVLLSILLRNCNNAS